MSTIQEIKEAITDLPDAEVIELRRWLSEREWERWDQQIERDSASGKLDFLLEEAHAAEEKGELKDL